jgi:glycosyltransferase involved in cell wall biosynthesis
VKILLISPTEKGIGGIAQHVQGLSQFLIAKNHKVNIISSENTFTIPVKGFKNPSFMLSSFLKTRTSKGNDVVHAHNIPSALAMKNVSGKKILTLHGIYSQQITNLHGKIYSSISKNYEDKALTWADVITAVSKETCDYYSKNGFDVLHVPNAINLDDFPKKAIKKFEKQIIFAGRLSKEKGIDVLLDTAKRLSPEYNLLILGTGPEEEKIRNISNSKANVHYLGYQSKQNTISLIRGSDLLIQPSIIEGISSTILEAMGCETCIIASNVGGNPELIENNKTGVLVEPNNAEELVEKISYLLMENEKRSVMAANGLKAVVKYDWKQIGKLYLDIYESPLHK